MDYLSSKPASHSEAVDRTTIYRLSRTGPIAKPLKSVRLYWNEGDIEPPFKANAELPHPRIARCMGRRM